MSRKSGRKQMKFKRFVTSLTENKHNYSSVQVDLPDHLSEMVINYGNKIPDNLIYDKEQQYGREKDVHVTVLYGLLDEKPDGVRELVREYKPFKVKLGKISAFTNGDDYDVLKVEVKSFVMNNMHYFIEEKLENKNSFPVYKPHVTVAYLKKRNVNSWVGDKHFAGIEFLVDELTYSSLNGDKYKIELRG